MIPAKNSKRYKRIKTLVVRVFKHIRDTMYCSVLLHPIIYIYILFVQNNNLLSGYTLILQYCQSIFRYKIVYSPNYRFIEYTVYNATS